MAGRRRGWPCDQFAFAGWGASRIVRAERPSERRCTLDVATEAVLAVEGAPGMLWPHRAESHRWRGHPQGAALHDLARALAPAPPPSLQIRITLDDSATFRFELAVSTGAGGTDGIERQPSATEAPLPCVDLAIAGQTDRHLRLDTDPFDLCLLDEEELDHEEAPRLLLRGAGQLASALGTRLAPTVLVTEGSLQMAFALGPDEVLLGLGERAGPWILNGTSVRARISDAMGTGTGMTYKAAPVLHSSKGWTLVAEGEQDVTVDAGLRAAGVVVLSVDAEELAFTLLTQPRLRDRLAALARRTGRPRRPPAFALGPWLSRSSYETADEVRAVAARARREALPVDVIHIDPAWLHRRVLSCDFEPAAERFGDLGQLASDLGQLGIGLSAWTCPYLDPESPQALELLGKGGLVHAGDHPATVTGTASRDGRPRWIVDFTSDAGRAWWTASCRSLLDQGVRMVVADFGEGVPDSARLADGRSGTAAHNGYVAAYVGAAAEAAGDQGWVVSRAGWAGSSRFGGHWSGDAESTSSGMAATLRAGLAWSLCAPGWWGHDVGGFHGGVDGRPSPGLYLRWAQFGAFSPLLRFHGPGPREPWAFGPTVLDAVKRLLELRVRLLPYLEHVAEESAETGLPPMRPLALEADADPAFPDLWLFAEWRSYLLGADLLVAPVFDDRLAPQEITVPIPPGIWCDGRSGATVNGPRLLRATAPADLPVILVRAGSVIPLGPAATSTAAATGGPLELHCWPGPERTTTILGPRGWKGCYRPRQLGSEQWSVLADETAPRVRTAVVHLPDGRRLPASVEPARLLASDPSCEASEGEEGW